MTSTKKVESDKVLAMKYAGLCRRDDLSDFEVKMRAALKRELTERGAFKNPKLKRFLGSVTVKETSERSGHTEPNHPHQ